MTSTPYTTLVHVPVSVTPVRLPLCRLHLLILAQRVYAVLEGTGGEVAACKEYRNDQGLGQESFLRLLLEQESWLRGPFLGSEVYWGSQAFTLVPEACWDERQALALGRALLDDLLLPSELATGILPLPAGRVLFALPPGIRHLLKQYLWDYTLTHLAAPLIRLAMTSDRRAEHLMCLLWIDTGILVAVRQGGALHLCNGYPCHSPEDAVYYLQAVREVCGLQAISMPLLAGGEWEPESPEVHGLRRWLPDIRVPETWSYRGRQDLSATPYWKYAFLCAS